MAVTHLAQRVEGANNVTHWYSRMTVVPEAVETDQKLTCELVNPSVRTLGFSPDGSLVTYWVRKQYASTSGDISIWAVPTLGGQPRPYYLAGSAELDWSHDGSRLAYRSEK
jgi:hypothetical protein